MQMSSEIEIEAKRLALALIKQKIRDMHISMSYYRTKDLRKLAHELLFNSGNDTVIQPLIFQAWCNCKMRYEALRP